LKNYSSLALNVLDQGNVESNLVTLEFNSTQASASTMQLCEFPWKSQLTSSSRSTFKTPLNDPADAFSSVEIISPSEVSFSRLIVKSTRETLFLILC